MGDQELPQSEYFELTRLTDGVFAAWAKPDTMAGSNCGIIDLGDRTAVVDAFLSPRAALDLRKAAETLTSRPVDLVFVTHHHLDHIWGCQVFDDDACILSSEDTYHLIRDSGEDVLRGYKEHARKMLHETRENFSREQDTKKRAEIETELGQVRQRSELFDSIRLRLPNLTSQGTVSFHGVRRTVEFIPCEKGHAAGNAVIHLPQDGILFSGDLLFARHHAFIADADLPGWLRVLEKFAILNPQTVVPGHGRLSTMTELRQQADYLRVLQQTIDAFIQSGKPEEALAEVILPEPFSSYQPDDTLLYSLRDLFRRMQKKVDTQLPPKTSDG